VAHVVDWGLNKNARMTPASHSNVGELAYKMASLPIKSTNKLMNMPNSDFIKDWKVKINESK